MKAVYDPETEMLRIGGGKSVYVTREEFEELREAAKEEVGEKNVEISKGELESLLEMADSYAVEYGSGTSEQVKALRHAAELLGLDPILYTPHEERKYHTHKASMQEYTTRRAWDGPVISKEYRCKWCSQAENHESHKLEM